MQIKIIIKTQRLTLSSNKIVCGTNNFIECLFDFQSSDWTELEKWALFKDGRNTYEMYIQEESQESKLRRQAVQAELQKLYEQMEQEKTNKKNHPLQTLIDKL